MFKTPPMESEAQFQPQFSTPQEKNKWKNPLMTPVSAKGPTSTPTRAHMLTSSPLLTPTTRADLSLNSSFDASSIFSNTLPTPSTSPIDNNHPSPLVSSIPPQLANPVLCSALPLSTVYSQQEIIDEIGAAILDNKYDFDIKINRVLGQGGFATVFECTSTTGEKLAVKIPGGAKKSKVVFKEMLNYRIVQQYLRSNGFSTDDSPILSCHGITFLNKSHYSRLRHGESVPSLLTPLYPSTLDKLITATTQPAYSNTLHIPSHTWWTLAKQLTMSLIVLKDCHMVHMDMKTTNILYDSSKELFKLADFTSAQLTSDIAHEYHIKIENGTFFDLTMSYCAPELLSSPPSAPNYDTDLYAMGLVLLAAAIGEEPYSQIIGNTTSSMIQLTEAVRKNKVLDLVSDRGASILMNNPTCYQLIKMILIERTPLDDITSYVLANC